MSSVKKQPPAQSPADKFSSPIFARMAKGIRQQYNMDSSAKKHQIVAQESAIEVDNNNINGY